MPDDVSQPKPTAPLLLTRRDAAAELGISEKMLRLHERAGRIQPAVIHVGQSDRRPRAYHVKAGVTALKEQLAYEALSRRTQQQADREFEEAQADDAKRTKLYEQENLAFEFEWRELQKAREAQQKELADQETARAAEREHARKIAELERENRKIERELRREKMATDMRTLNIVSTAAPLLMLGLAAWAGRELKPTIETTGETISPEIAEMLRHLRLQSTALSATAPPAVSEMAGSANVDDMLALMKSCIGNTQAALDAEPARERGIREQLDVAMSEIKRTRSAG
ncbi:MAG TPA: hypothetical protein VNW92_17305 [Polyangiaceae bacterium]|nr:hypothetical protein [Polyangiaceae bacterium]